MLSFSPKKFNSAYLTAVLLAVSSLNFENSVAADAANTNTADGCCSLNFKDCIEADQCGGGKEACEETCDTLTHLVWLEDGPLTSDSEHGTCVERWDSCYSYVDETTSPTVGECCPGLFCHAKNPFYSQCLHPADLKCSELLAAGDVAIIASNSDSNNERIVMVTITDLPAGLELFLTDRAWTGTSFHDGEYRLQFDGTVKFTVPAGGIPKGTVFGYGSDTFIPYHEHWEAVAGGTFEPSNSGDTLLLYCLDSKKGEPDDPFFLYGFHYAGSDEWKESDLDPSEYGPSGSSLPAGLEGDYGDNTTVPYFISKYHYDNFQYHGPRYYDSKETFLMNLHNFTLWDYSQYPVFDWDYANFELVIPTSAPSSSPAPTTAPTSSAAPTRQPSLAPTDIPTSSAAPSVSPTSSEAPSAQPSATNSQEPSSAPSVQPSSAPSVQPSSAPSKQPSLTPTEEPSQPTVGGPTPAVDVSISGATGGGNRHQRFLRNGSKSY